MLSEAALKPGLAELDLSGLKQVSETGLSWLANNCPTLLSINLAGCSVNRKGLKTLRQSWKYVYIKCTNPDVPLPFFGLAPEPRARDLRKIDEFAVAWKAAVRLQCLFRQGQALRRVVEAKERRLMNWVATKWQSLWRRRLAKRAYFLLKWQRQKEELAAIVMQNVARKIRALRIVRQRKHEQYLQKRLEGAILLQRRWRGKLSRDLYHLMLQAKREWEERAGKSAIFIQRRWRGLLGRKQYKLILAYKAIIERKKNRAATRVQTMLRGRMSRKRADEKREAAFQLKLARLQSAVTIQSLYRMRAGYKSRMQNIAMIAMRHRAATMLQTLYRGRQSRAAMRRWKEALEAQHRERAAVALQAGLRMCAAMLQLKRLREAKRKRELAMVKAVHMLQRVIRGIRGRQIAKSKQMDLLLDLAKQEALDKWAVTKVQSVCRGRIGRKLVQAQRIAVAHYWRTIFDSTESRNIYFNINTREVRMRKPQALLDLMPRIKCDNCNFYEATMECEHCTESFCDECWSSVHYGGKRKLHKFRALFDFYDKRIDYGDGEWPSKWPSEVVQDEFYGWYVREPNGRDPIEVGGWPWVKFLEDDAETEYYYNQKTEEKVYERPEGMDNHISAHQAAKVVAEVVENSPWKKYFDDQFGRVFYLNPDTGDSTYIRPAEFDTPREQREAENNIQVFVSVQVRCACMAGCHKIAMLLPRELFGTY